MTNNEKEVNESIINNILFFPTLKNGSFDHNISMNTNISNFNLDKKVEPSLPFFEYLCYKSIDKLILDKEKINQNTIIITEQFLLDQNCKELLVKYNAAHKKNIIICLQNPQTLKWNLIAFLNLEEQIKNYLDENTKAPILAKILSSNINSDEDDYILNTTMDKLEYAFDFKSPDDIQFELDSFNIKDQPNTGIFLLNFIKGLIMQDESKISDFIKKLYDEGSNNSNSENNYFFHTFNNITDEINQIYEEYQKELEEYLKTNKINENNEKMNENLNDDLNSDDEEEALKIMEKESEEAKSLMRKNERKLRQKLYKQKLKEQNMIMYKEFGVIKEEDNESESESIDFYGKMKEKKDEIFKFKENMNIKNSSKNQQILNNVNVNININVNNGQKLDELKTNIFKEDNDIQIKKQSDTEKNIKTSVLKELAEAIQEFESENEPVKKTEEKIKQNNEEIKDIKIPKNRNEDKGKIEESKTERKINDENQKEEIKNEKKIKKINNNNFFKNIEFKKRASVPKSQIKMKKFQLDSKNPNSKTTDNLKKSFTSTKRPDCKEIIKEKKEKEKEKDDLFKTCKDNVQPTKKKSNPIKDTNNDNSNKDKKINQNDKNESVQININTNNINKLNKNNPGRNNIKEEKNLKITNKEKEPKDNLSKKAKELNNIIKTKNSSKNINKITKKSSSKITKANSESQIPYSSKKSTGSSNKSEEITHSLHSDKELQTVKNKKNPFNMEKEKVKEKEKSKLKISSTDNPRNILPPQKKVERNLLLDLVNKKKEKFDGDSNSNINIDNIMSDFSEKDKKSDYSSTSIIGRETRTRKTKFERSGKTIPPEKIRNSHRYYDYGRLDDEDTKKICGCIGEQASGYCNIF